MLEAERAKRCVQILADAMRKTLSDPEFLNEYQKLSGEAASPLPSEALEKVIKELPRDANVLNYSTNSAVPIRCRGDEE